jgi:hypothetical protein
LLPTTGRRLLALLPLLAGCGLFASPENELTTVEGTVRNEFNQQPVPGARVELLGCKHYLLSGWKCNDVVDAARTDANGYYAFSFRTARKQGYRVQLDASDRRLQPYFPPGGTPPDEANLLAEGQANTVDLQAYYTTVLRLRVRNRNAGRRFMEVNGAYVRRAATIDTLVYLYDLPCYRPYELRATYFDRSAPGQIVNDTIVRKTVPIGAADTTDAAIGLVR